jgi:DNA-binding response OmpR family regulator
MSEKARVLVVEDDPDLSTILRICFTSMGYEVLIAMRGQEAIHLARQQLPNLIMLDIMLPDMTGYDVCVDLRTNVRTSHIPIIFLTQKDERSDKITSLELGADDYITKPFDIEELRLRVRNTIENATRQTEVDPRSNFPKGHLPRNHERGPEKNGKFGTYLHFKIHEFEPFTDVYGFLAGDDVIRFAASLIKEVVEAHGTGDDYIQHPYTDNFVVITYADDVHLIQQGVIERFNEEVKNHYTFLDRDRGYIVALGDDDQGQYKANLMHMSASAVS